ncbi:MAG: hypothetical protein ABWK05_05140 [Pyrobaculum sp.]
MQRWVLLTIALAAAALAAEANATYASDFHLWLKCKAVELYLNVTGVNYTIPQCQDLLANTTFVITRPRAAPLPMIGVGELKKLNVTDPRDVFEKLKEIRREAIANLTGYLNKTILRVYRDLNASCICINATEHRFVEMLREMERHLFREMERLREMEMFLKRVNASAVAVGVVKENVDLLNKTRQILWIITQGNQWLRKAVGNGTEEDVDGALAELERIRAAERAVWERLEKMKIAWLDLVRERLKTWLNETNATLWNIKAAIKAGKAKEIADSAKRGNIDEVIQRAKQIAEEAQQKARQATEKAQKAAEGGTWSRGWGR